jgi:FAR-17a/AIG1-like protein
MKKVIAFLIALAAWYAVVAQYFLMLDARVVDILETTIRFFSYFTILSNILVAIYFTAVVIQGNSRHRLLSSPGALTAITGYITIVGLIYQIALRHLWQPEGQQWLVDELLHTVIPFAVIIFWYFNESSFPIRFQQIGAWLIFPLGYFIFILICGGFSNFYPYPFVDVPTLGLTRVLINGACLIILYTLLSVLYIWLHSRSHQQ